ncbi:hypothetical protein sos41_11210 [Alphaproteobacteria bacterium SO-S41]|nr:hypothetical protein sos41_11210 [Alphaproteobacteria bacterium SO-S41]
MVSWRIGAALVALAIFAAPSSHAETVKVEAYADLRLVHAPDEDAWQEGGLGKTRFGGGDAQTHLAEIGVELSGEILPGLTLFAGARYEEHQRTPVDLMEAYLSYAPASDNAFHWSLKAGAFYPPISLENDQIGWASTWTITPSAINSWVGEELRTIGVEGRMEWRGASDRFALYGAVYGWNDPAGVLIADRGWALSDRPTGLFDKPRLPDAYAMQDGVPPPLTTPMFREMDGRAGWYAGASWSHPGWARVTVLRYDNNADPAVKQGDDIAWLTRFWSVGIEAQPFGLVVKAQGLSGDTLIAPSRFYSGRTEFRSAYLLVGKVIGQWRIAARGEVFETTQYNAFGGPFSEDPDGNERGRAGTLGVFWTPKPWLQLGGEALYIVSDRPQREVMGLDARSEELQVQTSVKLIY